MDSHLRSTLKDIFKTHRIGGGRNQEGVTGGRGSTDRSTTNLLKKTGQRHQIWVALR